MEYLHYLYEIAVITTLAIAIFVGMRSRFDVNRWLERRDKKRLYRVQAMCPHVTTDVFGDGIKVTPMLFSPSGTRDWQCQMCKQIFTIYPIDFDDKLEHWRNNPVDLLKKQKKFQKMVNRFMGI